MKRLFLPVLILPFAIPCWPKAFAQSPMPEIKPGKNSVAIRGRRQKLYFYPGAGAAPHHKILFAPNEEAEALFVTTKRPKHFALIHANNHSFESNRDGFFAALRQGMQWIKRREAHHAGQTGVCSSKIGGVEVARTEDMTQARTNAL
jgi:hypothetical protein